MRSILAVLPFLSLVLAHPIGIKEFAVEKRALSDNDTSVLQLALYLEHLERALYTGGYQSFTDAEYTAAGFPAGFRDNIGVIADVSKSSSTSSVSPGTIYVGMMEEFTIYIPNPIYPLYANSSLPTARKHPCHASHHDVARKRSHSDSSLHLFLPL